MLETYLEYDVATRGAPEVTVESTTALEDTIKQRILDEAFDDVEPRDAPSATTVVSQNKAPEVSQERSKKGLGELYEEDFLRDAMGYQPEPEQRKKEARSSLLPPLRSPAHGSRSSPAWLPPLLLARSGS